MSRTMTASAACIPRQRYSLRYYRWRSFITFVGPLGVFGMYLFICVNYLRRAPSNDMVEQRSVNASWLFYAWFLVSVFILGWGKAGIANFEACALMNPHLAPSTASQLMWHTDAKWANPLWWLRALRTVVLNLMFGTQTRLSKVGQLWVLLSSISWLLFAAIPLSGLSLEIQQVQSPSFERAKIYGPNETTFGSRAQNGATFQIDWVHQIRAEWQSGRKTSPDQEALLYAPLSYKDASSTYYDDEAAANATHIETFMGPAVKEPVFGSAWGMWANISCQPVQAHELRLIKVHDYTNYSINVCSTLSIDSCDLEWVNFEQAEKLAKGARTSAAMLTPVWLNENGTFSQSTDYSLTAAAEGFNSQWLATYDLKNLGSPFFDENHHDYYTADHFGGRSALKSTIAKMEIYLWSSTSHSFINETTELVPNCSTLPDPVPSTSIGPGLGEKDLQTVTEAVVENAHCSCRSLALLGDNINEERACTHSRNHMSGFGVQCDIASAVGTAYLSPATRQFRDFTSKVAHKNWLPWIYPIQIQALQSIAAPGLSGNMIVDKIITPREATQDQSTLRAIHEAIGSTPLNSTSRTLQYPALEPHHLQQAMYKLLGESLIALMDEGGIEPWTGNLYVMQPTRWLVPGIVPWQLVLFLLGLWALATSSAALWMMCIAGPRWAPSLSGFELFKFGAAYPGPVNEMESVDLQDCLAPLGKIPGMVGLLTTKDQAFPTAQHNTTQINEEHFIGLSETSVRWQLNSVMNGRSNTPSDKRNGYQPV